MKNEHVTGLDGPRNNVPSRAFRFYVRQPRQTSVAIERGRVVSRIESRAVEQSLAMRPANELERMLFGHSLEGDPHDGEHIAADRKVR